MARARSRYPRIKTAPKRQRRKQVGVRAYCRRKAESAFDKAARMRKSMPF